jgi:hypothetical protein
MVNVYNAMITFYIAVGVFLIVAILLVILSKKQK